MMLLKKFKLTYDEKSVLVVAQKWRKNEWEGRITNRHMETFRAAGYVHCLNYGDSFMDDCISKLIKLYTLTM